MRWSSFAASQESCHVRYLTVAGPLLFIRWLTNLTMPGNFVQAAGLCAYDILAHRAYGAQSGNLSKPVCCAVALQVSDAVLLVYAARLQCILVRPCATNTAPSCQTGQSDSDDTPAPTAGCATVGSIAQLRRDFTCSDILEIFNINCIYLKLLLPLSYVHYFCEAA